MELGSFGLFKKNVPGYVKETLRVEQYPSSWDICIIYFSIVVIKHHDKDNLQKKVLNLVYDYRGLESMIMEQRGGGSSS